MKALFVQIYLRLALVALLALALAGCGATAAAGNNAAAPWRGPTTAPAARPDPTPTTIDLGGPAEITLGGAAGSDAPAEITPRQGGDDQPAGAITLRLGETAEIAGLRLRFVAVVEDSRCPDGATCVWAGRAVVAVEVDDGSGAPVELSLGLPGVTPDAPDSHTLAGQQITFVDLEPYPAIGAEPADDAYLLTLQLQP